MTAKPKNNCFTPYLTEARFRTVTIALTFPYYYGSFGVTNLEECRKRFVEERTKSTNHFFRNCCIVSENICRYINLHYGTLQSISHKKVGMQKELSQLLLTVKLPTKASFDTFMANWQDYVKEAAHFYSNPKLAS